MSSLSTDNNANCPAGKVINGVDNGFLLPHLDVEPVAIPLDRPGNGYWRCAVILLALNLVVGFILVVLMSVCVVQGE